MGQNAQQMGNNSAEMAFGQQNAPGQMFGNLLGTAASLGGSYMGMQGAITWLMHGRRGSK